MAVSGGQVAQYDKDGFIKVTPCKVVVWAYQQAGLTGKEIAATLGIGLRTVERHRTEMLEYMGKEIDVTILRKGVYALLPDAMKAMKRLLFVADSPATIAYFKGLGLFIDKSEVKRSADESNKQPTERLEAEIVELIDKSEEPGKVKIG